MSEFEDAHDGEGGRAPSQSSEETTLQKVNLQELFDKVGRLITSDDYAYPFDLRCKDLTEVERNNKRQMEQALYGLHSAGKREAGMLGLCQQSTRITQTSSLVSMLTIPMAVFSPSCSSSHINYDLRGSGN